SCSILPRLPTSPLFPYTTLFRSELLAMHHEAAVAGKAHHGFRRIDALGTDGGGQPVTHGTRSGRQLGAVALEGMEAVQPGGIVRSEEHTSELQSREKLVCRLLLE